MNTIFLDAVELYMQSISSDVKKESYNEDNS